MLNNLCPKCNGKMEEGLVPDTNNAGGYSKQNWGTAISGMILKKVENSHELVTYRCSSCGLLESYAK